MRLILFDIDGTLLSCGPQVRPLFEAALAEVFGPISPIEGHDFAGKTDPRSVLELMRRHGHDEVEVRAALPRVRSAFAHQLAGGLRRDLMRLMPRVPEVLARLAVRPRLHLALLTGNWEQSGRIKLGHFDLNRFFPFGAFGDDAEDRRDLVPLALERASRLTGERFGPEDALIVGDTRRDVDCGRAHGVATLAVATGGTTTGELEAAGATWVVSDLGEVGRVLPELR